MAEQVKEIVLADPAVERMVSIVGFDFVGGGSKSNAATFFVVLKPWAERDSTLEQVLGGFTAAPRRSARRSSSDSTRHRSRDSAPPAGSSSTAEPGRGRNPAPRRGRVRLPREGQRAAQLAGVRTLFRPDVPQLRVEVDRERAKASGVPVDEIFAALQSTFGTLYVNDFTRSGRAFRVQMQAEQEFRSDPADLGNVYVRSGEGEMMPLSDLVSVEPTVGPDVIERFNGFPAAVRLLGAAAPGRSSGEAIAAMEVLAARELPSDFGFGWSGSAFQEKNTGGSSAVVFLFSILVVFLANPRRPVRELEAADRRAARHADRGAGRAGRDLDPGHRQRRLLSDRPDHPDRPRVEERDPDRRVRDATQGGRAGDHEAAAAMAARLRFRPIVMTSLAFVLGVSRPLVVSTGAGAASRHSIGTGVFGGMVAATFLAIFFIPVFYVFFRGDRPVRR